jgi:hypothetical protein
MKINGLNQVLKIPLNSIQIHVLIWIQIFIQNPSSSGQSANHESCFKCLNLSPDKNTYFLKFLTIFPGPKTNFVFMEKELKKIWIYFFAPGPPVSRALAADTAAQLPMWPTHRCILPCTLAAPDHAPSLVRAIWGHLCHSSLRPTPPNSACIIGCHC